jgi:hypothetical protein
MEEYYTLNANLQRDQLIQGFQSVIWTERYNSTGDFQFVVKSTSQAKRLLPVGTWITRKGSHYVGIIDTVSDAQDDNGAQMLTISGFFLENIFNDRVAMPGLTDTTTVPNWSITGIPYVVANELFNAVCVRGAISPNDTIPYYTFGTLLPTGNIAMPTDPITLVASPDTLYNTLQKLCQAYYLGFRLVKDGDRGHIYFEIYTGNDRSTGQSLLDPVVFDTALQNLSKVSYLTSTVGYKSVAYVFAANGSAVVYAPDTDAEATGADRRVLLVNSSNSDPAGPDLTLALQQEGGIALAQQRKLYAFDGELPPGVGYIYGVDYGLGDIVEERTPEKTGNRMMVTEQIFSSDDTGEHAFPTLTLVEVFTPGSWLSTPSTIRWLDISSSTTWTS